jgi:hypothetical protein
MQPLTIFTGPTKTRLFLALNTSWVNFAFALLKREYEFDAQLIIKSPNPGEPDEIPSLTTHNSTRY